MVLDGTESVNDDTGWYLVNIKLVLLGIRWYMVSKGLVCLYILEKSGDLVGCYWCLTDRQTTEYSATQLVYSIKFKLSHATVYK